MKMFVIIAAAGIGTFLGSRIFFLLTEGGVAAINVSSIFDWHLLGFSLYGGLILAGVLVLLSCWGLGLNPWMTGDAFAPGLGLGLALVKTGCFLNGCCFGKATSLPWGVSFPPGSQAHDFQILNGSVFLFTRTVQLHPLQLYEALAALSGALGAALILKKNQDSSGLAILFMFFWFTIWRWFLLDFRAPVPKPPLDSQIFPWIYGAILFLTGILALVLVKKRTKQRA